MSGEPPQELAEPSKEAQQALVQSMLPFLELITRPIVYRWKDVVPSDELEAIAKSALVEAARTYNKAHGVAFHTYAPFRIRGLLLDAIRKELRYREPFLEIDAQRTANDHLAELPRSSQDDPSDPASVWRARSSSFARGIAAAMMATVVAGVLNSQDGTAEAIARKIAFERAEAALQAARGELAERERTLLDLHYGQEIELREVAARMDVSYATAKRIHASMCENLGKLLEKRGIERLTDAGFDG